MRIAATIGDTKTDCCIGFWIPGELVDLTRARECGPFLYSVAEGCFFGASLGGN